MSLEQLIASLFSLGLAASSGYLLVKTYPNGVIKGWKPFLGTLFSILLGAGLGFAADKTVGGLIVGIAAGNLGPFIFLRAKGLINLKE